MGKKEYRYTYVDNTAQVQEDSRIREQNRLRNERRQREIAESQRILKEANDAAERERRIFLERLQVENRAEEEARQREERRQQEERQRTLELESKSVAKRQALFDYEFGTKINLASFRGLDISDVNKLRIGIFGPTGSGKSCFISTCERVVRNEGKGSSPIATSGAEGTIVLEDFLPEMFFRLVDTRGFFNYDVNEHFEFNDILYGRLRPGDFIKRTEDEPEYDISTTNAPFSDWIHGIILVVKANDPRLKEGALRDYLNPMRSLTRTIGIAPVTVVTHKDTLHTQEECDNALDLASAATGSSPNHTFFVANYCDANPGPNVETELQIFDILHFAILTAERYAKIAKQQKRNREEDKMTKAVEYACKNVQSLINPQDSVEQFLRVLQKRFKWKDSAVDEVLNNFEEEDIKTMGVLNANWNLMKEKVPLGMRNIIHKQLKVMFKQEWFNLSDQTIKLLTCIFIPVIMLMIYVVVFDRE